MQIEYIVLYQGCGNKRTAVKTINLNTKMIDYWSSNRLRADQVWPEKISEVIIGPKTVFEFFTSPAFSGQKYRVINSTKDDLKIYRFGCFEDHHLWRGNLGSFIVWTYDYWNDIHGTKYCNSDNDCKEYEMCLCKSGKSHPSWCPKSGRRCMSNYYFWHESPIPLDRLDRVYNQCFNDELRRASGNNQSMSKALLDDLARRCAIDKLENIEGFCGGQHNYNNWLLFLLIIIVLVVVLYYKNSTKFI